MFTANYKKTPVLSAFRSEDKNDFKNVNKRVMTGNFNVIESIINFRHGCGTLFIEPTRVVGLGLVETDSRSSSDLEDSRLPTVINCLENFRTALINNGIQ